MILQAITGMQEEFRKNIFPEMNASWRAYPTHISHLETDGCFRCHNDRHASSTGAVISKDCNLCHTIVSQGTQDGQMVYGTINDTMEFIHVNDDSQSWKEALCSECHRDMY
jgi:hypothetical protein